ncbi:MAG TPA: hypothetical protein V6D14_11450 [Coleofasciculaceae cyanobacterium]|jgi:hypothetical protein
MEEQTMLANLSPTEEKMVNEVEPTVERLTKREYFAALALESILKNSAWIEFSQSAKERGIITNNTLKVADENSKLIAELCVKYADALLDRLEEI